MKAEATDIRNQPAYGLTEAARYVRLPAATLRSWVIGRDYPKGDSQATFYPLIKPAHKQPVQLSFYNLIEAHVLRSLRTEHGVGAGGAAKVHCLCGEEASSAAAAPQPRFAYARREDVS